MKGESDISTGASDDLFRATKDKYPAEIVPELQSQANQDSSTKSQRSGSNKELTDQPDSHSNKLKTEDFETERFVLTFICRV